MRLGLPCSVAFLSLCCATITHADQFDDLNKVSAKSIAEVAYCTVERTKKIDPSGTDKAAIDVATRSCNHEFATIYRPERSPFDDRLGIMATMASETFDDNPDVNFVLAMMCKENVTSAGFINDQPYLITDPHVEYRIGKDKLVRERWPAAQKAALLNAGAAIKFLKSMHGRKGDEMVVRMRFNGVVERRFSLENVDIAIETVARTCGWKP